MLNVELGAIYQLVRRPAGLTFNIKLSKLHLFRRANPQNT